MRAPPLGASRGSAADPGAGCALAADQGRRDLADAFVSAYLAETHDPDADALLPLYLAYRAHVRAKVDAHRATEPEIPEADRARAFAVEREVAAGAAAEVEDAAAPDTPGEPRAPAPEAGLLEQHHARVVQPRDLLDATHLSSSPPRTRPGRARAEEARSARGDVV